MQREIALRKRREAAAEALGERLDDWEPHSLRLNRGAIAKLRQALAEVRGQLEWSFEGLGVYDHSIALARLSALVDPIGQTLRWTARDIDLIGPSVETPDLTRLVEPVLTGTFGGSFGLKVSAPPVEEQTSLLERSLFERTADRLVAVFQAAQEQPPEVVVGLLSDLRRNAIGGFQKLADRMAEAGAPTSVRWRGETVVTFLPADAARLAATISDVVPSEEQLRVRGTLVGGDTQSGEFHIVVRGPDGRDVHYRGRAEQGVAGTLAGISLEARVFATLVIYRLDSPLLPGPAERYVLIEIGTVEA